MSKKRKRQKHIPGFSYVEINYTGEDAKEALFKVVHGHRVPEVEQFIDVVSGHPIGFEQIMLDLDDEEDE